MKVAIVHYHLGQGGVSEVIRTTSRMMSAAGIQHVILVGPSSASSDLPVVTIEHLGYAENIDSVDLLKSARSAAGSKLGAPPDLWHFHNHSLGKNPAVQRLVTSLASEGERLLLQIHDLAEDGRPENTARITDRANLYPIGPRIHYAFINSRDHDRFINAGLPKTYAHLLPNPVEARTSSPPPDGAPLLLYPVRAIRRKNLGEVLLLAALAPRGTRVAITRAPLNPEARSIHDSWQRFSDELDLPVEFNVVDRVSPSKDAGSSYDEWIERATHLVTTSVSEGFGMIFPESAILGKILLGRNLPDLACDHATHGIDTGFLYDRLLVPLEWIDVASLNQLRKEAMEGLWCAWNRRPPSLDPASDPVDFGNLPEIIQQRVIRKWMDSGTKQWPQVEILGEANPAADWLSATLARRKSHKAKPYPPRIHQSQLTHIYDQLMAERPGHAGALDPDEILAAYLTPCSFHFLTSPNAKHRLRPNFTTFRAIIFDIYGTLLAAPAGGVKPDPEADKLLRVILARHGHMPTESPSTALHEAVRRHHASAGIRHPEVDLRALWREVLSLPADKDITSLVIEIENEWHPALLMPGANENLHRLAAGGIKLGILSNAQCNTLSSLGPCASLFAPDLTILSYQHGMAKPSPELFELLATRLELHGIIPAETLYIGNDPLHDIEPAAARGFRTALFTGDPDSHRHGFCLPDFEINSW